MMISDQGSESAGPRLAASDVSRRRVLQVAGLGVGTVALGPLLAACSSSKKSGAASDTVQMWDWTTEFDLAPTIKSYEAANSGAKIARRSIVFNSYQPALQAALTAKNEPDIFLGANLTLQLGAANRIVDIKQAMGQGFLDGMFPSINMQSQVGDKQYSIGWEAQSFGIFYNKTLLARAGVSPPQTWDELIRMAPVIRSKTGTTPLAMTGTPGNNLCDFFMPLITQAADDPQVALDLDAHTKSGVTWKSQPVIDALTKVKDLVDAKVFDPGLLAVDEDTGRAAFTSGKAAMLFTGSFYVTVLRSSASKQFLSEYAIAKTPAWASGQRHWTANQAGTAFSISSRSKNIDAAVTWLKYLYEPTRYATLMNQTNGMPAVKASIAAVDSPDIKQMAQWLTDGDGCSHIFFGVGTGTALTDGITSIIQGNASPQAAAAAIEDAVVQARRR